MATAEAGLRLVDCGSPNWRRVAERNLRLAGACDAKRVIDGVRRTLARSLVHFSRLETYGANEIHRMVEFRGVEHFQHARRSGRGVILVSGHLGNWELGALAHALLQSPLTCPVNLSGNPGLDRFLFRRRERPELHTVYAVGSARLLVQVLQRGGDVGCLDDFDLGFGPGVFTPFFGVTARASAAVARLAALAKAPVVPCICVWEHDRYVMRYHPAIPCSGDIESDTVKLTEWYESVIRQHLDQWMWIHMRWQTRPPGEPAVY